MNFSSVFKVIFAAAILYWLARSNFLNWHELKGALHPVYTPLVFVMIAVMLLAQVERFRLLLRAQQIHVGAWYNFKLFMIGAFFNYVIPGGMGGDAVKAYYLHKDFGHQSKAVPYTVLYDRFLGFVGMVLLAVAVIVADWSRFMATRELRSLTGIVFVMFGGVILLSALGLGRSTRALLIRMVPVRWQRLHKIFSTFVSAFEQYANSPGPVAAAFFWSFISQIASVLAISFVGDAMSAAGLLGSDVVPLSAYFVICPIGFLLTAIPISPGGVGVGQAAFFFLFNAYLGHKSPLGPASITWMQFVILVWALSGLYFYVVRADKARVR